MTKYQDLKIRTKCLRIQGFPLNFLTAWRDVNNGLIFIKSFQDSLNFLGCLETEEEDQESRKLEILDLKKIKREDEEKKRNWRLC